MGGGICSPGSDRAFGPAVDNRCRAFDFTLFFEDLCFACIPSLIFLTLGLIRVSKLVRKPITTAKSSRVVYTSTLYGLLLGSVLTLLGIRQSITCLRTQASVAAHVLQAADACLACVLSYLEFSRSVRPPVIIGLYLSLAVLFDATRLRTLWFVSHSQTVTALGGLMLGTRTFLLLSESRGKDKYLINPFACDTTREERSGLWGLCLLTWILPVLQRGLRHALAMKDIPSIDQTLTAERLARRLLSSWKDVSHSKKNQLLLTSLWTYRAEFFSAVIPRLCFSGFTIMQPLLVTAMIKFVTLPENGSETRYKGYGLIAASAMIYVGLAVSTVLYSRQAYRFIIAVRGGLIAVLYRQTLELRIRDLGVDSAITLMGTDVERIATGLRDIHEIWASPIDIGLAVWLLERQLAVSCIMPVVLSFVCISIITKISKSKNKAQRAWIEKVELRLHATRQVLNNIKSVKLLGLEDKLREIVSNFRRTEIITSRTFRSLIYWEVLISSLPWLFAPAASFTLFTIISMLRKEDYLVASQAFTALSLMTLITLPVWTFIQTLPAVVQCLGLFSRIQEYIALSSLPQSSTTVMPSDQRIDSCLQEKALVVDFRHAFLKWTPSGREVLCDVNLTVRQGAIIGILGAIGSGKTMVFESILGEAIISQGHITTGPLSIAYCTQTPWLLNATIRENIVGPLEFQVDWYGHVLWMCGLSDDLHVLPEQDLTRVGEQGSALSGGQKKRVALARAVYSECQLLLLDDVFSGLDPVTIRNISGRVLGYLRGKGVTVILSTHHSQVTACVDAIFLLKDGTVVPCGIPTYSRPDSVIHDPITETEDAGSQWSQSGQQFQAHLHAEPSTDDTICGPKQILTHQIKDGSVYFFYLNCAGQVLTIIYVVLILTFAFCQNFSTLWVKWWSNANDSDQSNLQIGKYLGVFIALGAGAVIIGAASSWVYLIYMISNTAERLHMYLLKTLLGAPLSWLMAIKSGDILNRFNQDLELTDMTLPLAAVNATKALGACLMKMIILFIVAKYMSLTVPPLLVICYLLQRYYLRTSKQVRLLSIEAKAPLYQHLSETLSGISTIRAFRWQEWVDRKNLALVDDSQKCAYTLYMVQQWLTLTMDMLAGGLVVLLMILVVFTKKSFDPGSLGTAIVTLMSFTQSLARLLKFWCLTESCLGAVSRIKTFTETVPSEGTGESAPAAATLPSLRVNNVAWPSRGEIVLDKITATYRFEPVLKSVSMHIAPGEKIAICGRSGSGKSSLLLCLGGLLPIQGDGGGAVYIDGVDIARFKNPRDILHNLSIVPQDPCFLPGTIRSNIDLDATLSQSKLERLLQVTHLSGLVQQMGGLESELEPGLWSAGQGQLLALARAMTRKSKILILDEATSRVDEATQLIMEDIIAEHFADCTVLSIVHRYGNILTFDKVAVLERGVLVEFERPDVLLAREESRFRALYTSEDS